LGGSRPDRTARRKTSPIKGLDGDRRAAFTPGEAFQFDWSHEVVVMSGVTTTLKVAHVRLCHSRMMFVRAYPRETQEMVFDAHDRAFAFFKGACARGIYDNMKTAVETIFVGKDRQYNRRFLQMCSQHLVDPVACTPASGWEKGQVENQVGLVRERFFTPRLRFKTYDDKLPAILQQTGVKLRTFSVYLDEEDQTSLRVVEVPERPPRKIVSTLVRDGPDNGWRDWNLSEQTTEISLDGDQIGVFRSGFARRLSKFPFLAIGCRFLASARVAPDSLVRKCYYIDFVSADRRCPAGRRQSVIR
jgi:hypothetical protein